jgi:hypothetical protein
MIDILLLTSLDVALAGNGKMLPWNYIIQQRLVSCTDCFSFCFGATIFCASVFGQSAGDGCLADYSHISCSVYWSFSPTWRIVTPMMSASVVQRVSSSNILVSAFVAQLSRMCLFFLFSLKKQTNHISLSITYSEQPERRQIYRGQCILNRFTWAIFVKENKACGVGWDRSLCACLAREWAVRFMSLAIL